MIDQPFTIAPEAYVIPSLWTSPGAPVSIHMSSMVLRGSEPVLFDTGLAVEREAWTEAVFGLVDPADVRWIVLSHDDPDHTGNAEAAMAACPNATLVATWFMTERLSPDMAIDRRRLRWVGPDESLDVGDRTLSFLRPPLYDSPTTRVVADPVSGVLWAADLFACPVTGPTHRAEELDQAALREGFTQFQQWNSPWVELVDRDRYRAEVDKLAACGISAIGSTHGPAFVGPDEVALALDLLRAVPDAGPIPQPGQAVLDHIVAAMQDAGAAPGSAAP
jgi:flavorubredoxin